MYMCRIQPIHFNHTQHPTNTHWAYHLANIHSESHFHTYCYTHTLCTHIINCWIESKDQLFTKTLKPLSTLSPSKDNLLHFSSSPCKIDILAPYSTSPVSKSRYDTAITGIYNYNGKGKHKINSSTHHGFLVAMESLVDTKEPSYLLKSVDWSLAACYYNGAVIYFSI